MSTYTKPLPTLTDENRPFWDACRNAKLSLLLTDRSEKLIASEIGVAPSTLHGYVRDILRKFGVSGRNGLIAVWLGRQA